MVKTACTSQEIVRQLECCTERDMALRSAPAKNNVLGKAVALPESWT